MIRPPATLAAKALPGVPPPTPLDLRHWWLVAIAIGAAFVMLEIMFGSGWYWRLPMTAVLKEPTDFETRAIWRIYNVEPHADAVVVLGSSMADAVVEPLGEVRQDHVFDSVVSAGNARVLNLSMPGVCHVEPIVLLENALRAQVKSEFPDFT